MNKNCNRCKVNLPVSNFKKKRCGNYMKQCIECNQVFKKYNKKGEKNINCTYDNCNVKFTNRSNLRRHIKNVHEKKISFTCEHCNKEYSSKSNLLIHIDMVHEKKKDFCCSFEDCDYIASQKKTLQRHIQCVHHKIKNFKCYECETKFFNKSHLKRHSLICTGKMNCSSGEFKIMQTLKEMDVEYQYNTSHVVKSDKGRHLRWDFIIKTGNKPLFIEYDGAQHFKPSTFGKTSKERAEKTFKMTKYHDEIKNNFCKENGYKLLRIPYNEYHNTFKLVSKFIIDNTDWGVEK